MSEASLSEVPLQTLEKRRVATGLGAQNGGLNTKLHAVKDSPSAPMSKLGTPLGDARITCRAEVQRLHWCTGAAELCHASDGCFPIAAMVAIGSEKHCKEGAYGHVSPIEILRWMTNIGPYLKYGATLHLATTNHWGDDPD